MTSFFKRKFSLPEGELGTIFSISSLISAASMLVASSIAKRIGNVKTMVFTHLPSAVCLSLISVMPSLPLALTFLILRACSQSMDVAPRSAFLAAALPADKRTAIMGAVNVVKTLSQTMGPLITGVLARNQLFGVSFIIAGCLKVIYDLGMLFSFAGKEAAKRKPTEQDEEQEGR
ncbi:Major facilitator superfamily domain general substrate transporter [Penicillium lagena]|uniref:Major facilitator superfamily domain general substrate transporter n=1 Tax=Penicillium lagena TaxID=94218 RepID=UPI0025414837|nr:Major facilitator superfamily domain general substrate transporter [Penicillium lagena]KAJ5624750.1 Major facilitator superfamily domain general substrate transporter [Penicillium lagena]